MRRSNPHITGDCFVPRSDTGAQKMAADSSVPAEVRELGRALQRIMLGDRNVDLSSLPRKWAELVKRELGG